MSKKVMTLEEKNKIFSDVIEVLKSGNKTVIDAFEAKVNAILKMVRARKRQKAGQRS